MSVKADKTFEEVVERLSALFNGGGDIEELRPEAPVEINTSLPSSHISNDPDTPDS